MGCTNADFSHCFVNLTIPEDEIFSTMSDIQLDNLCGQYPTVQQCVEDSIDLCTARQKTKIQSQIDVLTYLCTTGYEGYKKTRPCLENTALLEEARSCNATFTAGMGELQNMQQQPYSSKKEHICSCVGSFITCLRDSGHRVCGKEAGDWIYSMKTRMISATASQYGCNENTQHFSTALAISSAILIALLVIVVAFIVIYKKVKAEDEKEKSKILSQSVNRSSDKHQPEKRGDKYTVVNSGSGEFHHNMRTSLMSNGQTENVGSNVNTRTSLRSNGQTENLELHGSMSLLSNGQTEKVELHANTRTSLITNAQSSEDVLANEPEKQDSIILRQEISNKKDEVTKDNKLHSIKSENNFLKELNNDHELQDSEADKNESIVLKNASGSEQGNSGTANPNDQELHSTEVKEHST